jgi:hemolysin activation/secretion protein
MVATKALSSVRSTVLTTWLGALLATTATLVPAQTAPPGTQPGQIERQFQTPPQPRSQSGSFALPLPAQTAPPGAEAVRFRLRGLTVDGMSVYTLEDWRAEYYRLLGRQVSLADIYAFANAITARYRNDGYLLSQVIVPPQAVEEGAVRLQVIEGYVAAVRIEGDAPPPLLRAYAERIAAQRPLTAVALERNLLLMNDLPGGFARALLAPSATQPGASDLIVQYSSQRVGGGISVDNRGGRALGPLRGTVELEQRGLLGWGDRTGVRFVAAEHGEMKYFSLTHDQALNSQGTRVGLNWNRVRSRPDTGTSFIPLDLETESDSGALTLSHAMKRSRSENLYLRAALTAHNGETMLFGVRDTADRIRALRLGLTYDLADTWRGVNIVDAELSQGFEGAGSSKAGDPFLSRTQGQPAFTKLALYGARLQPLAAGFSVLGAITAQVAFDDLLAPELFSFGGEQFGRGYDPSELVGDHGAALKLELRYTLNGGIGPVGVGATFYGFYDTGFVRQRSPGGLEARQTASSAGLGLRYDVGRYVSGYLEYAKPLTRIVAAEGNRDARGYAGLSLRY